MFQNYFIHNGTKYYTGTVIVVNNNGKNTEASFVCYNIKSNKYIYKIGDCRYYVDPKYFYNMLIAITDKKNNSVRVPQKKTKRDSQVNGIFIGWCWYIFLMVLSAIFNGAIFYWIIISIIFFNWKAKKIKEEGTYIEW